MRRLAVLAMAGALTIPAAANAQDVMPWAEYRAAAQAAEEAEIAATSTSWTFEDWPVRFEEGMARWQAELDRLAGITPEECYAAGHTEFQAFWRDYLANFRDALPMFEQAESMMGLIGPAMMVESIMRQAHPAAYVEASTSMTGYTLDRMHLLDSLQTCETPLPSSAPGQVSEEQYGDDWPLTISDGVVSCNEFTEVVITASDGTVYGLNGAARGSSSYEDARDILKPDRVPADTQFLIDIGLEMCA
ncbi:MAG: hypothetical protein KF809_15050 [Chloroflexi bacterium]|nr:hypothetical protein [Chloroflexota bacterium]